jgi:transcriptional regulator with XRE-family HTH domain
MDMYGLEGKAMSEPNISSEAEFNNGTVAARIREELARRRMSRQQLAASARVGLSTLEKALNGSRPFTLSSLVRLENALGLSLRAEGAAVSTRREAPAALGQYASAAVRWLEGDYLTLRTSFEVADAIFAYRTSIAWDDTAGCLLFHESHRQDAAFAQRGEVSIPNKSGHIYLHTNEDGQFRLAILGRPLIGGEMYGLLTTLQMGSGTQLLPVSTPFALIREGDIVTPLGRILPGSDVYAACRMHLQKVLEGGFARLVTA